MNPLLDAVRAYLDHGRFDPLIEVQIRRVVRSHVKIARARRPSEVLDATPLDGLDPDSAFQEFVVELLEKGLLRYMADRNSDDLGLVRGLELLFRQFLQRSATAPRARRVYKALWGVLALRVDVVQLGDPAVARSRRLLALAEYAGREPAREGTAALLGRLPKSYPAGAPLSPALLAEVAVAALRVAAAPVPYPLLASVVCAAMGLSAQAPVTLDDSVPAGGSLCLEDRVAYADAAAQSLASLTPRQRSVLVGYAREGSTYDSVAGSVGCSRGTVENELRRIGHHLTACALDLELDPELLLHFLRRELETAARATLGT